MEGGFSNQPKPLRCVAHGIQHLFTQNLLCAVKKDMLNMIVNELHGTHLYCGSSIWLKQVWALGNLDSSSPFRLFTTKYIEHDSSITIRTTRKSIITSLRNVAWRAHRWVIDHFEDIIKQMLETHNHLWTVVSYSPAGYKPEKASLVLLRKFM